MKINERTLIHVANSNNVPIDKQGWLYKRGEINRSFQKRWCVLKGNNFYYFDKKGDREPIGVIILEGCRIELAENELELFSFKILFGKQGRTYVLGSDKQDEMELWMKALSCASYDYLKMMVAELQTQLDEINQNEQKRQFERQNNKVQTRTNPFDNDPANLIDFGDGGVTTQQNQTFVFSKRPFAEIHEYYSLKFRSYFEQQRNIHQLNIL